MSSSLAVMAENCPTLFIDSTSLFALPVQKQHLWGTTLEIAQRLAGVWSSYSHSVLGICYGSLGDIGVP
jgi:hypothetical protein